jgi:hypothetical protein
MRDDNEAEDGVYVYGDAAAAREVGMPIEKLRLLRAKGKLAGAVAKLGHRTTIYHRNRLKRRVDEVFKESA